MNVMDTIMTATHCVLSALVGLAVVVVEALIAVVVDMVGVIIMGHEAADSRGHQPPLAVLITESKCLVC